MTSINAKSCNFCVTAIAIKTRNQFLVMSLATQIKLSTGLLVQLLFGSKIKSEPIQKAIIKREDVSGALCLILARRLVRLKGATRRRRRRCRVCVLRCSNCEQRRFTHMCAFSLIYILLRRRCVCAPLAIFTGWERSWQVHFLMTRLPHRPARLLVKKEKRSPFLPREPHFYLSELNYRLCSLKLEVPQMSCRGAFFLRVVLLAFKKSTCSKYY